MKQFKTLLLIAVFTLGMTSFTQAQSKVGHISTDELIASMPAAKALDTELTRLKNTYDNDLKALDTKLKAKFSKYQNEAKTVSKEENQKRMQELQTEEQALYAEMQKAEQELAKKRNDKLKPIVEAARKAIAEVAKENGYQYVLDSASLLVANGTDLLPLVKKKLGI